MLTTLRRYPRSLTLLTLCIALLLAGPHLALSASVLGQERVGFRYASFRNPTKSGSRGLRCLIWYPSSGRRRAVAEAPEGGHPVVVFLHGMGGPAFAYTALGRRLAKAGFVAVFADTAIADAELQRKDARALFMALDEADRREGSAWYGKLDMGRVGLSGHSMGGGSTAHVLAENPGYRAGFCFAPWPAKLSFADSAAKITVPMGIVHGKGDTVLPWRSTAKALYDGLGEGPARRFLYLLDGRCKHQNVARSVFFGKRADKQVFAATSDICVAFFEEQLRGRGGATAAAFDAAEGAGRAAELWDSRAP